MIGFININKNVGDGSTRAVSKVKRIFRTPCGHMGTLDPLACGVLPIALGRATRLFDYTLDKVKEYDIVPKHYDEYITDRYDLVEKAKILPTDNKIERLYKMSKLNYFDQAFVIKSE